eukprot:2303008-Amphidinium_carterae.1
MEPQKLNERPCSIASYASMHKRRAMILNVIRSPLARCVLVAHPLIRNEANIENERQDPTKGTFSSG